MPSGTMMIRHVPTKSPVPMAEMIREWFCERPNDKGKDPAKNELGSNQISALRNMGCKTRHLRRPHDNAEAQQNEKSVPHADRLMMVVMMLVMRRYSVRSCCNMVLGV